MAYYTYIYTLEPSGTHSTERLITITGSPFLKTPTLNYHLPSENQHLQNLVHLHIN